MAFHQSRSKRSTVRWRVALGNAYPAELETLAKALELPYQKDRDGILLMRQMSRPRKARKGEDKTVLHWVFDAEKLARLVEYCAQDVRTTRAVWQHPKTQAADRRRTALSNSRRHHQSRAAFAPIVSSPPCARDLAVRERTAINAALAGAHRRRHHLGRPGGPHPGLRRRSRSRDDQRRPALGQRRARRRPRRRHPQGARAAARRRPRLGA